LAIDLISQCRECSLPFLFFTYLIDLYELFVGTPNNLNPQVLAYMPSKHPVTLVSDNNSASGLRVKNDAPVIILT